MPLTTSHPSPPLPACRWLEADKIQAALAADPSLTTTAVAAVDGNVEVTVDVLQCCTKNPSSGRRLSKSAPACLKDCRAAKLKAKALATLLSAAAAVYTNDLASQVGGWGEG